jgi:phosphoenolpyruvate carboxykinase (ATP)
MENMVKAFEEKSSYQKVYNNLSQEELITIALAKGEGVLASNKALTVQTGARTGRSPKDRFIVKDAITEHAVDWNTINQPITSDRFHQLWRRTEDYLKTRECLFTADLFIGSDPTYQLPVHLKCELAWHALFAKDLLIERPNPSLSSQPAWTILSAPSFQTDPQRDGVHSDAAIILNFTKRRLLICGTHYAGEIKKGMFSVLNFILPPLKVLPMHCSANQSKEGNVALFFGLSGTGKTTLSADPNRYLIGDDEHGWSPQGIFNFEGGCYAKCINLSQKKEPLIWNALRSGTVMENVVLDPITKEPRYEDDSLTQNTRAAYPLTYIDNHVSSTRSGHPQNIIFLSCDLYGVLPPVARLTAEQAAYYFLSGYTALVGSTEVGEGTTIKPTFSTCFGAPFFSRPASEYAHLLLEHLQTTQATVYLVNTGWTGGPYGKGGSRFSIPTTRAVIHAILDGHLKGVRHKILPRFGFEVPDADLPDLPATILDPQASWQNPSEYPYYADQLIQEFKKNFEKFKAPHLEKAGPM